MLSLEKSVASRQKKFCSNKKCIGLPRLLHGCEVCPLVKSELAFLDFVVNENV